MVEDHALLAESLCLALRAEGVAATRSPVDDLSVIERVCVDAAPATVLLDLDLGAAGDGAELVASLSAAGCRVVVVTGDDSVARWGRCLAEGAVGVVSKTEPMTRVVDALRAAATGLPVTSSAERHRLIGAHRAAQERRRAELAPFESLSPRERVVLGGIVEGRSVAELAASEVVSQATVRAQVRAVLTKLGVSSQLQAAAAARRAGWKPPRR